MRELRTHTPCARDPADPRPNALQLRRRRQEAPAVRRHLPRPARRPTTNSPAISGPSHSRTSGRFASTSRSADAILPNALVVAFDSRVRFEPVRRATDGGAPVSGALIIPVDESRGRRTTKPGWIVDGQQRTAAIRDADVDSFPVYVTAFITDSVAEQRSQFILVNSTKPLPKGLIHELLPATPAEDLPLLLLKRRYPAHSSTG